MWFKLKILINGGEDKLRCPRCGKQLKDNALFCSRCGSKINPTSRINPVVANRASLAGNKVADGNSKSDSSGFGSSAVLFATIALIAILLAGAAFAVMDTGDSDDNDDNGKVVSFSGKDIPVEKFGNKYQITNIYNLNAYYFAFLNVDLYDIDVLAFIGNPIAPDNAADNGNVYDKELKDVVVVPEADDSDDDKDTSSNDDKDTSSDDSDEGISDLSELMDSSSSSTDDSSSSSDDKSSDSDSKSSDDKSSDSDSKSSNEPDISTITINSVTVTGDSNDNAECEIYVGSEYAGCQVEVSALYTSNGQSVNDGQPVTKTVDSNGKITIKSSLDAGSDGMVTVDLVNVTISEPNGPEICYFDQPIFHDIGTMEDTSSDSSYDDSTYDDTSYDDSYYDDSYYDDSYYDDEYYY